MIDRFTWMPKDLELLDTIPIITKGGKGSGNYSHGGRPGKVGGSVPGKVITSKFDATTYWRDQENVTLYHGTSLSKLESIQQNGLTPGHSGEVYFTSSPQQAGAYSIMGGEQEYLSKPGSSKVPDNQQVILELAIPPSKLTLNGAPNFQTREAYNAVKDAILEIAKNDINDLMLEFTSTEAIPPSAIKRIYRLGATVIYKGGKGSGNFGHEGIPGHLGGSAKRLGGIEAPWHASDKRLYEAMSEESFLILTEMGITEEGARQEITNPSNAKSIASAMAANHKISICTRISDETKIPYDTVVDVVAQWAGSSNDADMRSLSLQQAVSEEFGVPLSDFQTKSIATTEKDKQRLIESNINKQLQRNPNKSREEAREEAELTVPEFYPRYAPITTRENERKILRAMYNQQQAAFKRQGYDPDDEVTIYRGTQQKLKDQAGNRLAKGASIDYKGNAIESWTISSLVADSEWFSKFGHILSTKVKIKDIFCSYTSGFGCLDEKEIVVFGSKVYNTRNYITKTARNAQELWSPKAWEQIQAGVPTKISWQSIQAQEANKP